MTKPKVASVRMYLDIYFVSLVKIAMGIRTAIGYIAILWYQHKTQGGRFMTSEKNSEPKVAQSARDQIE